MIPVYNEPRWIGVAVNDAVAAVARSSFEDVELVLVDDGSDEDTQRALAELSAPFPVRVLRQQNSGRLLARRAGIEAARGDLVLLLDARVSLRPDSLGFISDQLNGTGRLPIWNAHCDVELHGNPYARFWNALAEIAYREYCANPRTVSYGIDEFDRFPKGTTCFLAPRVELLDAVQNFESHYTDSRNANDDTSVIRLLAARQPINISPGFACLYRSRDSLLPFLKHAFHRGVVFIDGWARPGGRFFGVIVAFYPLSALALALALRRPRLAAALGLAAPLGAGAAGAVVGRSRADCAALGLLGPPWLCVYGAGMWRGLWLLLRARAGR